MIKTHEIQEMALKVGQGVLIEHGSKIPFNKRLEAMLNELALVNTDSLKYRAICKKFNEMKASTSLRFLECLGLYGMDINRQFDDLFTVDESSTDGTQPSRLKPRMPAGELGPEDFCYCNKSVSLQIVSGGGSPHGYLGRVTLKIDGKYVDYVRADRHD